MLPQCFQQRRNQVAHRAHPSRQGRAIQIYPFTRVNLRLAMERLMIAVLGNQNVGEQTSAGDSAFDGPRRRRRFYHSLAATATELGAHMTDDAEALRNVIEHLADVLAKTTQLPATVWTG